MFDSSQWFPAFGGGQTDDVLMYEMPDGQLIPFTGPDAAAYEHMIEPVHIAIPASEHDPRNPPDLPSWIVPHYVPDLHPDDCAVVDGLPCTSVSRTLIDMAQQVDEAELRALFARARDKGMLDAAAMRASRARVEWRPSLAMLDRVIADFC